MNPDNLTLISPFPSNIVFKHEYIWVEAKIISYWIFLVLMQVNTHIHFTDVCVDRAQWVRTSYADAATFPCESTCITVQKPEQQNITEYLCSCFPHTQKHKHNESLLLSMMKQTPLICSRNLTEAALYLQTQQLLSSTFKYNFLSVFRTERVPFSLKPRQCRFWSNTVHLKSRKLHSRSTEKEEDERYCRW